MTQPPLVIPATVEVPQAEKTTLANGATLYTLASDDFEVLRITFVFRAGSAVQRVPFSASAAANMLAEGTRDMTAQQIAEQLDYYGSYFDVNIDRDYAYISFCTLSKFFGQTLAVAEQVLLHPTFPEEELRTYCAKRKQGWPSSVRKWTSKPAKRSPGRCSVPNTPTAFRPTKTITTA